MARPSTIRGTYISVLMGNGATPTEVFAVLCGLNAKSIAINVGTADEYVRDCADPEDVPVRELITTGKSWSISGSGVLNRTQFSDIEEAVGEYKNFRFFIGEPAADNILNGYLGGEAVITALTVDGGDGSTANVDISIESNGEWTWTDVA